MMMTAGRSGAIVCFLLLGILFCSALPWEETLPGLARRWYQAGAEAQEGNRLKRAPGEGCPQHPKPLPQDFINQLVAPDAIKKALAEIDSTIFEYVQNNNIKALSAGVVYDQQLIWSKSMGLVNPSDPSSNVTIDTPFRVGSITKALTTLMLLQLRDAGKVVLDDPVKKYVPNFAVKSPYKNNAGITWRSLASQNSGLQGSIPCDYFSIFEPIFNDACDITNDEAWKRFGEEEVLGPMYSKPHYADAGYAIIGRGLESVLGGVSYEDYITKQIFLPLGMKNTFFDYRSHSSQVPQGNAGNTSIPNWVGNADLNWARPTGQAYSTVRDLQKFMSLFFQGEDDPFNPIGVLSSSIREMLQIVSVNDDASSGYGMPWEIFYSKTGGISLPYWVITKTGAMPGYSATMFMIPEMKLGFIVAITNFNPLGVAIPAFSTLVPAFEQTFIQYALPPPSPANISKFEGVYLASALLGVLSTNMTVKVVKTNQGASYLNAWVTMGTLGAGALELNATWVGGNTFRVHIVANYPCLDMQSGWNDVFLYFQTNSWTGNVYSLTAPGVDPFYGWIFYKQ